MKLERIEVGLNEEQTASELEFLALLRSPEPAARWKAERLFGAVYGDSIRTMLIRTATDIHIRSGKILDVDGEVLSIRQAFFDVIADREAHATDHGGLPKTFWRGELSKLTKRGKRRSLSWLVSRVAYVHNRDLLGL